MIKLLCAVAITVALALGWSIARTRSDPVLWAIALDLSGSFAKTLKEAKSVISECIFDKLQKGDKVVFIAFANSPKVIFVGQVRGRADRSRLISSLMQLKPSVERGTNIAAAVAEVLKLSQDSAAKRLFFLISDGFSDPPCLSEMPFPSIGNFDRVYVLFWQNNRDDRLLPSLLKAGARVVLYSDPSALSLSREVDATLSRKTNVVLPFVVVGTTLLAFALLSLHTARVATRPYRHRLVVRFGDKWLRRDLVGGRTSIIVGSFPGADLFVPAKEYFCMKLVAFPDGILLYVIKAPNEFTVNGAKSKKRKIFTPMGSSLELTINDQKINAELRRCFSGEGLYGHRRFSRSLSRRMGVEVVEDERQRK